MQTLSKGYFKPQNTDTGDVWMPAIATDMQMLNDHTHDGVTSQLLAVTTVSILAAAWVAAPIGGGIYRQLVTLPAGFNYDTSEVWFHLSTGELVFPSVERVSTTTFYAYTSDNTLAYTAFFR
jgi:hypothetical protein